MTIGSLSIAAEDSSYIHPMQVTLMVGERPNYLQPIRSANAFWRSLKALSLR